MTVNCYCSLGLAFWGVFHFEAEKSVLVGRLGSVAATCLGNLVVPVSAELPGLDGWGFMAVCPMFEDHVTGCGGLCGRTAGVAGLRSRAAGTRLD